MGFLDANGITHLVEVLGNVFEYKLTAGYGISIDSNNTISSTAGAVTNATSTTVSLTNSSSTSDWKNVATVIVAPGSWVDTVTVSFASNSTGIRRICLSTTSTGGQPGHNVLQSAAAIPDVYTTLQFTFFLQATTQTTYYINAVQTSGSTLNCYPRIHKIQIV